MPDYRQIPAAKICSLCHGDCSEFGQPYAYELTRGPGMFDFRLQAIAPISAIEGEAVCRRCYVREFCFA